MRIRRVLVVEDNAAARDGLMQFLKMSGLVVTGAVDGHDALARLAEQQVDVMLVDVWMPRMNGLELLGQLGDASESPKVIVLTADDTPETLLMTLRQRAHRFVRKPIDLMALLRLLHDIDTSPHVESEIQVLSARPAWIELLVSGGRDAADRIQGYIVNLDVDLPMAVRETMGQVFRELLLDAMECDGPVDPTRKVRISYLRGQRMMLYRIGDATAGAASAVSHAAAMLLQPGAILARAQADELLYNEARNEVVVVKYLD